MSSTQTTEKKYTQEDLDKEIEGKNAVASHLNNTKFYLAQEQKKTQQLYNIIMKSNDLDMIEDMLLNTIGIQIPIKYYAIKSTYINKKKKKSKCWKTAYGKYVGKRASDIFTFFASSETRRMENAYEDSIPIITGYRYFTKEEFNIELMGKGNLAEIVCKDSYTIINGKKVQVVEECMNLITNYDTEEEEI